MRTEIQQLSQESITMLTQIDESYSNSQNQEQLLELRTRLTKLLEKDRSKFAELSRQLGMPTDQPTNGVADTSKANAINTFC